MNYNECYGISVRQLDPVITYVIAASNTDRHSLNRHSFFQFVSEAGKKACRITANPQSTKIPFSHGKKHTDL